MIQTIIFDFGGVFIDLNKHETINQLINLGLPRWNKKLDLLHKDFEEGKISEFDFFSLLQFSIPETDLLDIRNAWNADLGEFPLHRLEFLHMLKPKFNLILLSNTNSTHIDHFEHQVGQTFAKDFYGCFDKVYFSFELGMRKPEIDTFKFILNNHHLTPKETLFIDDTLENIEAAKSLDLKTWHINPEKEDVTQLFEKILLTSYDH